MRKPILHVLNQTSMTVCRCSTTCSDNAQGELINQSTVHNAGFVTLEITLYAAINSV
jgi:hypothetical protein